MSVPRLDRLLRCAENWLSARGVDSPRLSAQLLAASVLGMDRLGLFLDRHRELSREAAVAFWRLVRRRGRGEPVAYLLGEKEFWGRPFVVTPAVLVPRPETEHLVEEALRRLPAGKTLRFADFGTGSGILAVTMALEFPGATGVALDRSLAALYVARENARRHGVAGRVTFTLADFAAPPLPDASLDVILANPPYVSEAEYAGLDPEVRDFEPREALVPSTSPSRSGETAVAPGLEAVAALAPAAWRALRPGGLLLVEIGALQGRAAKRVLLSSQEPWAGVDVLRDLAGRRRVLIATRAQCG